jgi:E3 ubiquitin-protein ligase synoviolin
MADMAMEGRWEGKGVAVFYLELTLDMLHLLVYCAFFAVVFSTYGIPLHLVGGWLLGGWVGAVAGWLWC